MSDGGVHIGGNASVQGDVVGRDKITTTTTTTSTTGMAAEDFNKIFDNIYKRIEALPPQVDKADVRDAVDTIKAEAEKEAVEGGKPDEKMVKLSANSLINMAPDILEVIAATFANPAAGVATVIRKILDKARGQATA